MTTIITDKHKAQLIARRDELDREAQQLQPADTDGHEAWDAFKEVEGNAAGYSEALIDIFGFIPNEHAR